MKELLVQTEDAFIDQKGALVDKQAKSLSLGLTIGSL